ncbi:MAG: chaperonin GroEL [Bacillota bacterium]
MSKDILYSKDARTRMKKGVDRLTDTIGVTIGPKGRNVVLEKSYGSPLIANDGVTIAKEISLKDRYENMGAQLVQEVASKTNDAAGDGTTTATLLAQNMIHNGIIALDKGANPVFLREGITKASKAVSEKILEYSRQIKTNKDVASVATVSSGSDEIGDIIADAMDKVGKEGVITVDESKGFETELEVVEGLQYDKGYISPYMVSDREKMEVTLEDAYVLVTDQKISTIKDVLPVLEQVVEQNKPLFIVASDIENEVVSTLVVNKLRGTFNVVATKAPSFGDNQKAMLTDIAYLTGATFYSKELDMDLKDAGLDNLGLAKKIVVTKDTTTILEGAGNKTMIDERVEEIRNQIENTDNEHDKKKLRERLGKLTNGVAIIKVGATTETELKEKKLRIEDALNATKAAVDEGIVLGGGAVLIQAYNALKDELKSDIVDVQKGINIVLNALLRPTYHIAENAGYDGNEIVDSQKSAKKDMGFDAKRGEWVNMITNGIIDPTKVTRNAVLNASSIAGMFVTTEAAVVDLEDEDNDSQQGMGGMY